MLSRLTAFVSSRWALPSEACRVEIESVQGGLESTVLRVRVATTAPQGACPARFVVKQLMPGLAREADVYTALWRHLDRPPAVRVIGREDAADCSWLYLEDALPWRSWPWSDTRSAAAVCRVLARFHDDDRLPPGPFAWSYEDALARSAQETLQLAQRARHAGGRRWWPRVGDLRRVVAALPLLRARLLADGPTVIHGDLHPGNVILRGPADADVVLIDWARTRLGSPLEDIASWLHSLGCWEPQARRRHDTLMGVYLGSRRRRGTFSPDVRRNYWFACASNGLSGAIRYHLAVLSDDRRTDAERADSVQALGAWKRVMKRTAALLTASPPRRRRAPRPVRRPAT